MTYKKSTKKIEIDYKSVKQVTISYFKLNMEVLFSKDPFLNKNINNFTFVNPNYSQVIDLDFSQNFKRTLVDLPEEVKSSPVFVDVTTQESQETLKIFNSGLKVHLIEKFGLLKVANKETGKLLSKIYVKCYFKNISNGEVKFYKDGYTDFRGSFDYSSLNSNSLDSVDEFSILVFDETLG